MNILALDIGGTSVKYGFFNEKAVFGEFSVKDSDGTERLPEKLIECISKYPVDCDGICAPGPFDYEKGIGLMEHKLKSLYKVSLRELILKEHPNKDVFFVHDATAFVLGEVCKNLELMDENVAGVMLGTGLGYIQCDNGKAKINQKKTPSNPLWNRPYKNGIAENYVSATAIINKALSKGYLFNNVKEIAECARKGERQLLDIFFETGEQLGELIEIKKKEDGFKKVIIGGQVSRAWDLMGKSFEKKCSLSYYVVAEPEKSPLWGIKYCAENGIENIYIHEECL